MPTKRKTITTSIIPEVKYEGDLNASERGLVEDGRTIDAIKALRERTGCGLLEARDICVTYRDGRPWAAESSTPQTAKQMTTALKASIKKVRLNPPKRTALEVARQLHAHAMDAASAAQELVDALASGSKLDWEDVDCPAAKLAGDITDSIDLMTERLSWLDESEG